MLTTESVFPPVVSAAHSIKHERLALLHEPLLIQEPTLTQGTFIEQMNTVLLEE